MTQDEVLFGLLIVTFVLSLTLILTSGASFGRILADIEYQRAAEINGVRRIQSIINLRTHGNRTYLGLVFLLAVILNLVKIPEFYRLWTSRTLIVSVLLFYTLSSLLDWFDHRKQVHLLLRKERGDHEYHEHQHASQREQHHEQHAQGEAL